MAKNATEKLVENLLLFDPVTERGRERLRDLDLHEIITPDVFFDPNNKLWASPVDVAEATPDVEVNYDPTPDAQRIEKIKQRRKEFDGRFHPDSKRMEKREFTLLMGVVGAGKSVELQRQLYSYYKRIPYSYGKNPNNFTSGQLKMTIGKQMCENAVYIDMERVNTEIPIGRGYRCSNIDNALALFFTKLLATLIYYIKFLFVNHKQKIKQLGANLELRFNNQTPAVQTSSLEKYEDFVKAIMDYANDQKKLPDVFRAIMDTIKSEIDNSYDPIAEEQVKREVVGISAVLHMLGFVMIGANPEENKCIIVDNVEDLIKVNNQKEIKISLDAAKEIYQALLTYAENIRDIYDDAGLSGSFHVVMALRRTTWDNLQAEFAGDFDALLNDMFDITGDITITELWNKKGYPTWRKYLLADYDDEAKDYIETVNRLLSAEEPDRNSIQQRFSRIMSNGLRRQGHSLSKTLYNMFYNTRYGIFKGQDSLYIGKSEYSKLFSREALGSNREARYLRKSATVEFYFMDQYTRTGMLGDEKVGGRWRSLDIGRITNDAKTSRKYYGFNGKRREEGAEYPFTRWEFHFYKQDLCDIPSGNMLRRLLKTLAAAPEAERASKCIAPLYESISLRTVMKKVLNAIDGKPIEESKLLKLSETILAGSRPDTEGEYSPLFLFENGVDIKDIHGFKETLAKIWHAKPIESEDGDHLYSRQKCGIRITEAGADFLYNIQPSYEFFSAMLCYDFAPLFFVKSPVRIAHIIGCVYHYADEVCRSFESAGDSTFRAKVKELHTRYLGHYRDYLDNLGEEIGLSSIEISALSNSINSVIDEYYKWG